MDTGPLVAYFDPAETHHDWAVQTFARFTGAMLTCEAVLTETSYLVQRCRSVSWPLMDRVIDGTLVVDWQFSSEASRVRELMKQYADRPISFADACLVRLAEKSGLPVCTLDSDFRFYRISRRREIPIIGP